MLYDFAKRALDIVGSLVGLILLFPLLIVVGLAVKLSSQGPVLVEASSRVGKNNKIFRMYKFRTMVAGAHKLIRTDPKMKEVFEEYKKSSFKLKKDPRVTQLGKFLRKSSLDELPQFLNVLKSEMSLVGPRAFYPDELTENKKRYPQTLPDIEEALKVKPGITGLWQVSGRSKIGFTRRIKMDAHYARFHSLTLDLKILLKTPFVVLKRDGVY